MCFFLKGRRRKGDGVGGWGGAALSDFPEAGNGKWYLDARGSCERYDPSSSDIGGGYSWPKGSLGISGRPFLFQRLRESPAQPRIEVSSVVTAHPEDPSLHPRASLMAAGA